MVRSCEKTRRRLMVVPPLGAVTVPPQVDAALAGVARVTGPGRMSVNARSVTGIADGLVIVKVRLETAPGPIVVGVNALLKDGTGCPAMPNAGRLKMDRRVIIDAMARLERVRVMVSPL